MPQHFISYENSLARFLGCIFAFSVLISNASTKHSAESFETSFLQKFKKSFWVFHLEQNLSDRQIQDNKSIKLQNFKNNQKNVLSDSESPKSNQRSSTFLSSDQRTIPIPTYFGDINSILTEEKRKTVQTNYFSEHYVRHKKHEVIEESSSRPLEKIISKTEDIHFGELFWNVSNEDLRRTTETLLSNSAVHNERMTLSTQRKLSLAMHAWSKRNLDLSGEMAGRILERMLKEKFEFQNDVIRITPFMFNVAINAWLCSGAKSNVNNAADILERMLLEQADIATGSTSKRNFPLPNIAMCNVIIENLGICQQKSSAIRCERILRLLENLETVRGNKLEENLSNENSMVDQYIHLFNDYAVTKRLNPTTRTYNGVMNAWAQACDKNSGEYAERILHRIRASYILTKDKLIQPNSKSFNIVIKAWANSRSVDSAMRAENVLLMMEKDYSKGINEHVAPDTVSYTSVLTAWVKTNDNNSVCRAEKLLSRMEAIYMDRGENSSVIPDTIAYNAVLNAYSKSDIEDGEARCLLLFAKMNRLYDDGSTHVKPNKVTFNSVINVIATNAKKEGSCEKVSKLFGDMIEAYVAGDSSLRPDLFTYNSVLKTYCNSRDKNAVERAERLFYSMNSKSFQEKKISVSPDTISYNTLINCWAYSGHKYACEKAECLLREMINKYVDGDAMVKPTVVSYNSVLNALSKSKDLQAPQKSQALLEIMVKMYKEGGEICVKPDVYTFSTVINTWSRSKDKLKAEKAVGLLHLMKDLSILPNVFVYSACLNACAHTNVDDDSRVKAFQYTVDLWRDIQASPLLLANHVTYATYLKACSTLVKKREIREALIESAWIECVENGQVGEATLNQLRRAASDDLYFKLLGDFISCNGTITIGSIPLEWKCNVKEKKRRNRWRRN